MEIHIVAPKLTPDKRREVEKYLEELLVFEVVQYELGFKNKEEAPAAIKKVLETREKRRKN